MPASTFVFGDLVVHRGDEEPRGVGLLAELRRSDARVQFLREQSSVWSSLQDLRRARGEEVDGSLEKLVADLLAMLQASEMELTIPEPDRYRLIAGHGAILPEAVDRLREHLGARLSHCVIRPAGMHRMQTIVEFHLTEE